VADDLRVGHLLVGEVAADGFTTPTGLAFSPVYDGAYVTPGDFGDMVSIGRIRKGRVNFAAPLTDAPPFTTGEDAWVINVGPGDRVAVPRVSHD
jgi:hypothetical protein